MEEEAEEDALGYLTLLLPVALWLFDLLGGVTPLLQVGLSAPGCGGIVAGGETTKNAYLIYYCSTEKVMNHCVWRHPRQCVMLCVYLRCAGVCC